MRIISPALQAASRHDLANVEARAYNPDMIEYGIVGLFVLVAAIYLLRALARSFRGADHGCSAGCGCGGVSNRTTARLGKRIDLVQLGASDDRHRKNAN